MAVMQTPDWVHTTIAAMPEEMDGNTLAALLLTITDIYITGKPEKIEFLISVVATYCTSIGLNPTRTAALFEEISLTMKAWAEIHEATKKQAAEETPTAQ